MRDAGDKFWEGERQEGSLQTYREERGHDMIQSVLYGIALGAPDLAHTMGRLHHVVSAAYNLVGMLQTEKDKVTRAISMMSIHGNVNVPFQAETLEDANALIVAVQNVLRFGVIPATRANDGTSDPSRDS